MPTLRHIVNNCEAISAVQYLPDVLELMGIFSNKFHGTFKREGAAKLQIGDFVSKYQTDIPKIKILVENFITAWNIMAANQRRYPKPVKCILNGFLAQLSPFYMYA